jgi:hypothetical protein
VSPCICIWFSVESNVFAISMHASLFVDKSGIQHVVVSLFCPIHMDIGCERDGLLFWVVFLSDHCHMFTTLDGLHQQNIRDDLLV